MPPFTKTPACALGAYENPEYIKRPYPSPPNTASAKYFGQFLNGISHKKAGKVRAPETPNLSAARSYGVNSVLAPRREITLNPVQQITTPRLAIRPLRYSELNLLISFL